MSQNYTLLIVESPAKAKTIEKYLKDLGNYKVTASVGHVRDLPKSSKNAIDIEKDFLPHYEISPGKREVISRIKKLATGADEVLLAMDPDREGEAIAWHIAEVLKLKKPKRVTFNEITKEAIQHAVQHPRTIDTNLREAQEARRVLDRLVGYDLSGLIWKKVRYGLSAGRVQSPALRIIMEREREIRAFNPETFWVLRANLGTKEIQEFITTCKDEPRDEKEVSRILDHGNENPWHVENVKETDAKRSPKAPFTTSTLQQTASSRLGYSPKQTMGIAQKLYEAGLITYMRTDSTNLSAQAIAGATKTITAMYGKEFVQTRTYAKKSKNAQEAHEAIRPSTLSKKSAGATADQKKLYELIWARTITSQMIDAKIKRSTVLANTVDDALPSFKIIGSRVMSEGWLKADPASRGEDTEVPHVAKGDSLKLNELTSEEKQTTPPPRYSEAGLIKELEKRGIGRPSTYASIISTIVERGYVNKEQRSLIPTDTGDVVSSFLENNFEQYISDSFTAEMENELDEIASGDRGYAKTLKDFYTPFKKEVDSKEDIEKLTTIEKADSKFKCPQCKSGMDIKLGKNGKFLSCEKYPNCDGAMTIDGKEIGNEKPIGVHPENGKPIFVLNGKFGPYVQEGEIVSEKKGVKKKGSKKENKKKPEKPRRASIPADMDAENITLDEALHLLVLPRILGEHPETGKEVVANIGRFGPYVGHDGDFRSIKKDMPSPYEITLAQALDLLKQPKQPPRGAEIVKVIGAHPRTKKEIVLYKSKTGLFLKKGLRRIYLPDSTDVKKLEVAEAVELLKQ